MKFLIALATLFVSQFALAQATTWTVDGTHASVVFKVNHMGFSNVYGFVTGIEGMIAIDEAKPEKTTFDIKIPAGNINTGATKRDDHLKGPDFFNVKQFPFITLKSKSVKKSGDKYEVAADLTLHGVTKPVTFTFNRWKTGKDPFGNNRTGGDTTLKIKRTDYGMTHMAKPGEVGDEVELLISLEATSK